MTEGPCITNGWTWIFEAPESTDLDRRLYLHRLRWNGTYLAPCPCGRIVTWDAYHSAPGACECMSTKVPT